MSGSQRHRLPILPSDRCIDLAAVDALLVPTLSTESKRMSPPGFPTRMGSKESHRRIVLGWQMQFWGGNNERIPLRRPVGSVAIAPARH